MSNTWPTREEQAMRLSVNGQEATVSAAADLRPYWQAVRGRQFSEVWLNADDQGSALAMLVNGEHAWLMYIRNGDDPGLTSRNPEYVGSPDALLEFVLANGQLDEYPMAWTFPLEEAIGGMRVLCGDAGRPITTDRLARRRRGRRDMRLSAFTRLARFSCHCRCQ
jgi:hypothetical protein